MLVIAAPQVDLTEREAAILDRYWSSEQGRVLCLLDPSARTVQLYRFLARRGVMPMDNRVLCTVRLGFATGILREVTVDFMDKNPVTKRLVGMEMLLSGETQSLLMDPNKPRRTRSSSGRSWSRRKNSGANPSTSRMKRRACATMRARTWDIPSTSR